MPLWMKMNNMESASPIMQQLMFFHDISMNTILMITIITFSMMIMTIKNKLFTRNTMDNQPMEIFWTILPSMILLIIAIPSLKIIYMMEELSNPMITVKTMGHQWYWTYEYSDSKQIEIESYMKKNEQKMFRLLDVDNRTILPMLTKIRMIISSTDVLHSWTIPSLGTKMDAVPGRLNQIMLFIDKPGLFYGQCSEICGTNHSFMPITVESVNMKNFIKWIEK
uniref:cytochrome c oxidase subunit II n=1 Tax=Diostrombus politus TaxID=130564 RepID=UPI002A83AF03|nr:cytochrome c oxidase subunit II [Diostrombus politus]WOW99037.1 cytochrome c oxidase subunit II [Diostrombus politus]